MELGNGKASMVRELQTWHLPCTTISPCDNREAYNDKQHYQAYCKQQQTLTIIQLVLKIHDDDSKKNKDPILVYNHCSQK